MGEDIQELMGNPSLLVHMLAMEFLSNFNVVLAKPDIKSLENQKDAIAVHDELYDKVIEYFMSAETLDASLIGEEAAGKLQALKGAAKATFMRRWLAENGIMPEVFELTSVDDDGKPALNVKDDMVKHTESIALSVLGVLKKTTPVAAAADLELGSLGTPDADSGTTTSNSDEVSEKTDTSLGGNEDFDFPDMGQPLA